MFDDSISVGKILQKVRSVCSLDVLIQLGLGFVGVISLVFGWWHVISYSNQDIGCSFPQESSSSLFKPIVVSVTGAVKSPGVVSLEPGSRLSQAIEAAGGYTDQVDTSFLNQKLNLSSVVSDQEQVFIPFFSDSKTASDTLVSKSEGISINSASATELESLPGIGEKRAEEIIAGRPYQRLTELMEKEIISDSLYQDIKSLIAL